MGTEIERKFLVKGDEWRSLATGVFYRQGYIYTKNGTTVRVRLVGTRGYLTLKSPAVGISRREYEYAIPGEDAREMLETLCDRPQIEKTRYQITAGDVVWEVDEFSGENQELIMAEVELTDENQIVELPSWIGEEVSGDRRYFNSYLAEHPFSQWDDNS